MLRRFPIRFSGVENQVLLPSFSRIFDRGEKKRLLRGSTAFIFMGLRLRSTVAHLLFRKEELMTGSLFAVLGGRDMLKTLVGLGCIATLALASSANAAFIIEPNGLASANYSAANATGNSTTAGSGTLMALGLTPGAASVFGGEPYTYTYTPGVDGDNTVFSGGEILNSAAGLSASGIPAGSAGIYNVYLTYPQSANQGGQPAIYDIDVNGDMTPDVSSSYDQNIASLATGLGIGLWEQVGQITVTDVNQPMTLTISPSTTPNFVGIRTAGVMFEPVPEPAEPNTAVSGWAGFVEPNPFERLKRSLFMHCSKHLGLAEVFFLGRSRQLSKSAELSILQISTGKHYIIRLWIAEAA